ncbi:heterogeneous nuclear ribonucleoprotein D-like isoform X1 [Limulus polyphemus]|uniref:Heterogeneous nuclear ribonucleoprotein D-like isoform X1 n=1 Tax=Limulus polyphemus TaxID=6850 RepID=A0ABM1B183_LIMPO|nr:heterogeneous nuclear ribonucleoprotein D-like isoform X1 [Limulus polyphemus]
MGDDNQYNGQNQDYSDYNDGQYGQYQQEGMETDGAMQGGDSLMDSGKGRSDDDRKLFVGGVSWDTQTSDLKDYFSKYGEVTDVNIKTDPNTGKSRGFAFVTFASQESVDAVLKDTTHSVKGKQIDPKRAKAKPGLKKIFVGGLDPDMPESDIRAYFEQYGKVETIELPIDKVKNQRRQFAFITFESEDAVKEITKQPKQMIGSKECDVKKAAPKLDPRSTRGGFMGGWGAPNTVAERGRGRGGYQAPSWGSQGYGGYNQGYGSYNQGYGSYDYSGYGGDYSGGYGGYDYTGWGYGQNYEMGSVTGQQASGYGKTRGAGRGGATATTYHPYR